MLSYITNCVLLQPTSSQTKTVTCPPAENSHIRSHLLNLPPERTASNLNASRPQILLLPCCHIQKWFISELTVNSSVLCIHLSYILATKRQIIFGPTIQIPLSIQKSVYLSEYCKMDMSWTTEESCFDTLQRSRLERGVKLNSEHHPVPGLGMSGATLPTFHTPSRCKQDKFKLHTIGCIDSIKTEISLTK
jgi:hypothetical protein